MLCVFIAVTPPEPPLLLAPADVPSSVQTGGPVTECDTRTIEKLTEGRWGWLVVSHTPK